MNPNRLPEREKQSPSSDNIFRIFGEKTIAQYGRDPNQISDYAHEEILTAFGPKFPFEDFQNIHGTREIIRDAHYASKKLMEYGPEKYRAKNLENVTRFGVENAGWLDTGGRTLVFPTYRYDDYAERADFGIAIIPPADSSEGRSEKLPFAVDVTYNASKIEEKLARSSNDKNLEAPFRHTRLKYYNDGEEVGDKIVPRFVIAMDYFDDDKLTREKISSPGMLRVRFKVLSQLVPQAEEIAARLSDSDPDEDLRETRDANDIYENLDSALRDSVDAILGSSDSSFRLLCEDVSRAERNHKSRTGRPLPYSEKLKMVTDDISRTDDVYAKMLKKLEVL